jgi:hypothetical protein
MDKPTAPAFGRKPDWKEWANRPIAELWEAVLLSFDIEPIGLSFRESITALGRYPGDKVIGKIAQRMRIALQNLHSDGPLKPSTRFRGLIPATDDPAILTVTIDLVEFSAWAVSLPEPISLPKKFPRTVAATVDPSPSSEEVEPAEFSSAEDIATPTADADIDAWFDLVTVAVLEAMFPAREQWKKWAERAKGNGLIVARVGHARFNPYLAGKWFLTKGEPDWTEARLYRVLAKNLPARSHDKRELLMLTSRTETE